MKVPVHSYSLFLRGMVSVTLLLGVVTSVSCQSFNRLYKAFPEYSQGATEIEIAGENILLSTGNNSCVESDTGDCVVLYQLDYATGDSLSTVLIAERRLVNDDLTGIDNHQYIGVQPVLFGDSLITYEYTTEMVVSDTIVTPIDTLSRLQIYGLDSYEHTLIHYGAVLDLGSEVVTQKAYMRITDLADTSYVEHEFELHRDNIITDLKQIDERTVLMTVESYTSLGRIYYNLVYYDIIENGPISVVSTEPIFTYSLRLGYANDKALLPYYGDEGYDFYLPDFSTHFLKTFELINNSGESQWSYHMGIDTSTLILEMYIRDITESNNGDFLICGNVNILNRETWSANILKGFILRLSPDGDQVFFKLYEHEALADCGFKSIKEGPDGYLLAAGNTEYGQDPDPEIRSWVIKVDADGCFDDDADCTISSISDQNVTIETLAIAPNPVESILQISLPDDARGNLSIIDQRGVVALRSDVDDRMNLEIDVEALVPGPYIARLISDSGQLYIGKFVKM